MSVRLRALLAVSVALCTWCAASGQYVVLDKTRLSQALKEYVLQSSILAEHGLLTSGDREKLMAQDAVRKQIGDKVEWRHSPPSSAPTGDVVADGALVSLQRKFDESRYTRNYAEFSADRRVVHAALAARLAEASRQRDGQPLDWTQTQQLAAEFGAIRNDVLAASIAEANVANEARIERAQAVADALAREEREAQRTDAEAQVQLRLRRAK